MFFFRRHLPVLLLGVLLWTAFTWPLPRHFTRAIPYTDRFAEGGPVVRTLVPGDHLQLLYHFWLAADMLAGHTPRFRNVYEFNLGDDDARYIPDPYYFPFSWVYAAVRPWGGDAAGWNAAGLVSLLLGVFGLFALARRYAPDDRTALWATSLASVFPYRWITLLTGSPTGFAMGLVPLLLLGLDVAVRDRRARGAWLAGAMFFCAYCADLHVFYFSALAIPAWCAFAWLTQPQPFRPGWRRIRATAIALLPLLLLAAITVAISMESSRHLATTAMSGGRTWIEVVKYSPLPVGLFGRRNLGMSNHVFFGGGLALLLAAGLLACAFGARRPPRTGTAATAPSAPTRLLLSALLALAVVAVVALALGANGPLHGAALKACRRVLPKYTMIRQTVKIYCLMPSLLAVLLALLLPAVATLRRPLRLAVLVLGVLVLVDARDHIRAGLCGLPARNLAYEGIGVHALGQGQPRPRALALPLWPGDSHWSSLYEYAITRSRVRLVNGYAPAVPARYAEQVLTRFSSLNQGVVEDAQLDALAAMGVRYVTLHEDAFPEQVSPFPVGITLRGLLANPRLEPLARDGTVWSFVIRDTPRPPSTIPPAWGPPVYGASRQWVFGQPADGRAPSLPPGAVVPLLLRSPVAPAPQLRYLVRVAGGTLVADNGARLDAQGGPAGWQPLPCSSPTGQVLTVTAGQPRVAHALLTAGVWPQAAANGTCVLRAADLFHGGATHEADGSVLLEPLRDGYGAVVYGPNLPLPPGRYALRLDFASEAPAGTALGILRATETGGAELARQDVRAGQPCATVFDYPADRPLRLEFHYNRRQAVRIASFTLARGGEGRSDR